MESLLSPGRVRKRAAGVSRTAKMNYKKVANSIAHAFATDDAGTFDLPGSIENALRRAAKEAAVDGYVLGFGCASFEHEGDRHGAAKFAMEMAAKYLESGARDE